LRQSVNLTSDYYWTTVSFKEFTSIASVKFSL